MKSFIEKYKPKNSKEIPQPLGQIRDLIENKESILIYGQTGTCKTTSIYKIAEELDYEILELNASDFRTKDQIESIMGQASQQTSLFQRKKILLIDEVDCLSGTDDRGGASAIANIIKTSKFPIILTANDGYNDKIKDIKKLVTAIEFKPINSKDTTGIIKDICEKENIKFSEESLRKIAINSSGDLRAAINDLQSNTINKELIVLDEPRDYEISIIHALNAIFKTKDFNANNILEKANINLDEYTLWLDENLPMEYKGSDLSKAYELLSKADILKGRIRRQQYWRFLYYQSLLLSSGISVIKDKPNNSFTNYKRSMRPLKIWQSNIRNGKKKSIAEKLSAYTHTSRKGIIKNFKFYKSILNNKDIINELKLDDEEIIYLEK